MTAYLGEETGVAMLKVEHLAASYGLAQVLFDISFTVGDGEVVTLIGRNGMGKTTTIFALMGLVPPQARRMPVSTDCSLIGLPPYRIAQAGIGLVPEGRQIFPTLTVEENLIATAAPRASARRAGRLSASTISFPRSPSAAATWAMSSPAASSRCSRSAAR